MGGWDTSEDKLVNDIACMFFDAQTVKSVPSDYARSCIAAVRAHDEAKRWLERFMQDDSGLPTDADPSTRDRGGSGGGYPAAAVCNRSTDGGVVR